MSYILGLQKMQTPSATLDGSFISNHCSSASTGTCHIGADPGLD